MKIGVLGCGAIGGLLAQRLAASGQAVTIVELPEVAGAIRSRGLSLIGPDGSRSTTASLTVLDAGQPADPQDVVFLGVKANQLPAALPGAMPMIGPGTVTVTLQNGIPWWYFQREGGRFDGHRLISVDPDGRLAAMVPADSIVGCVAYPAAVVEEPGVIRHVEGDRFPLGELDGGDSTRVRALAAALDAAGFRSRLLPGVRAEVWLKAVGSAAFNPLSAITGMTMAAIAEDPVMRERALALMREAEGVAGALGVTLRVSVEKRLAGAQAVGHHKTSMLQDVEAGRPTERAALLDAIIEIGTWTGVPTPELGAVAAELAQVEARSATRFMVA